MKRLFKGEAYRPYRLRYTFYFFSVAVPRSTLMSNVFVFPSTVNVKPLVSGSAYFSAISGVSLRPMISGSPSPFLSAPIWSST
ncbi:MAG: hypothetical protein LBJ00_18830 [Planctomycetaceae bacterium]|nr:hypothetical protein [Planctomycetaceae bacterium]